MLHVSIYNHAAVINVTSDIRCLDLLLSLEVVPPVAKLARLSCVFLCSSDLFLERPVQKLTWGLFRLLTRSEFNHMDQSSHKHQEV